MLLPDGFSKGVFHLLKMGGGGKVGSSLKRSLNRVWWQAAFTSETHVTSMSCVKKHPGSWV